MITVYVAAVQDDAQLAANIVTIISFSGVVLAFISYLFSRLTIKSYYGINQVVFSPPIVSESVGKVPNSGIKRVAFVDGKRLEWPIDAPIVVIMPINLINTDIFPETLTAASLTIERMIDDEKTGQSSTETPDRASVLFRGIPLEIGEKKDMCCRHLKY
ncbi:MAG: hypothetical protein ACXV3D_02180, partial [Halobacteriota archaeon]